MHVKLDDMDHLYTAIFIATKAVIPSKAGIQKNVGFPRIKYGAGLVKPGMTNSTGLMSSCINPTGFTLLEVVVTMTILGLILVIVFGAFRLGLSAWDKGEQTREEYQQQRTATQLISRQIKSSVPYKIKTQKAEGDYLAFQGNAHSLRFVSTLSLRAARPDGFVFAIYEFKEGGSEGGRLVAYEKRVINKDFFEEGPKEEEGVTILEGLSDVRLEYFREEDPQKTRSEAWLDEWNAKEEKELPAALKMTITFKNARSEKEEASLTLLSFVAANKFEDVKAGSGYRFRSPIQQRLQRGGS